MCNAQYTMQIIRSFNCKWTKQTFDGKPTKETPKRIPKDIWRIALRKLGHVDAAHLLDDSAVPPGNRLESLKRDWASQYSIRINDQRRVCFTWKDDGRHDVEIVDHHKGGR